MEYWIAFSLLTYSISIILPVLSDKHASMIGRVMLVYLSFFACFRYMIGWDYYSYYKLFDIVEVGDIYIEQSFIYIVVFLRYIGADFQSVFVVYEIGIMAFIYMGYKKHLENKALFWVLYAFLPLGFLFSLGTIRQALAVSIVFFGIKYIYERNVLKFVFTILLATLFHTSAIVCVLLYSMIKRKYTLKSHVIAIVLSAILFISGIPEKILLIIMSALNVNYVQYIVGNIGQKPSAGNIVFYLGMWMLILYGYTKKGLWNRSYKDTVILNMCTMTNIVFFLCAFSYELIRIREYFSLFYIVAIVNILYSIKRYKYRLIASNIFVILALIYFFVYLNNWETNIDALTDTMSLSAGNIDFEFNFKLFR